MKIFSTTISNYLTLNKLAPNGADWKNEFRRKGQSILRQLAKDIGLAKGQYTVRWNPGGPAVSGDHILHTDKVYLDFSDNLQTGWFYWRRCDGPKDYGTRYPNQIVYFKDLLNGGWQVLVGVLRREHQQS